MITLSMRLTARLIGFLVALITLVVLAFTLSQVHHERRLLIEDMSRRSAVLVETLDESLVINGRLSNARNLQRLVEKYGTRPPFIGLAVYDATGRLLASSKAITSLLPSASDVAKQVLATGEPQTTILGTPPDEAHFYIAPLDSDVGIQGIVAIAQNTALIHSRMHSMWTHGLLRVLAHSFLIVLATLLAIRWYVKGPIARATDWLKKLRRGEIDEWSVDLPKEFFGPLAKEVRHLAHSLTTARAAAEEEAKLRQTAEALWTPERLRQHVETKLEGRPLYVISNREPCMHVRKGKQTEWIVPASGLVTALEPVLRVCGGTWIAHGAGDADRDTVDNRDHVRVPPDDPQYTLRRIWLSKEEENGYYYGFSNEGLWPLCHIAHTRPLFRAEDWAQYKAVNEKFARAALEEMKDAENPIVLVQDYHFALLPRLIKEKRPDARVALFWHIPWPNPESFSICPWQKDILHGMLGADLLGFHIQYHCNNFLDTVDRTLESRIDWERFNVNRQGHTTWVKPFPISVAFAQNPEPASAPPDKAALFKELGIKAELLGVGVDRVDYTKGIVERFRGIERFLEQNPDYLGRFTFVELGAPSRSLIKRYHDLMAEVEAEAERINWRFQTKEWKPIVFFKKHHSQREIAPYYRAADVCLVTSLHDGMNLVAKEYVAAREDEGGVLILSRFTGASRDLRDALLVNPYDTDKLAAALHTALTMSPEERQARMHRMRESVREHNIYWWGANLITELAQVRLPDHALKQGVPSK